MRRNMRFLWPILAAVCGCGWMLIQLLGGYDLYLHLGGLNSRRAAGALLFLCLVFLFIWADMALGRSVQTKGGRIGLCFVLLGEAFLLLVLTSWWLFGDCDPRYYTFRSPDGAYTVIVEEESWLLCGWSNFYEPVCPGLMRKLDASLGTDDGYRPFSAGRYQLTWEADQLLVDCDFGSGGVWGTCRVPLGS